MGPTGGDALGIGRECLRVVDVDTAEHCGLRLFRVASKNSVLAGDYIVNAPTALIPVIGRVRDREKVAASGIRSIRRGKIAEQLLSYRRKGSGNNIARVGRAGVGVDELRMGPPKLAPN